MKFVKARCIDVCILGGKSLKTNVVLGVYRPNLSISCLHNIWESFFFKTSVVFFFGGVYVSATNRDKGWGIKEVKK